MTFTLSLAAFQLVIKPLEFRKCVYFQSLTESLHNPLYPYNKVLRLGHRFPYPSAPP